MPIMDGFETADLLKINEKTKRIPIIFLTALSRDKKDVWKGYEKGAVDYIFKPIEPVLLKSKVRVFLEIYQKKDIELKYTKLKQANEELLNLFEDLNKREKSRQKEQKILDELSKTSKTSVSSQMHGSGPINKVDPEFYKSVINDFKKLIEQAIEAQIFKVDFSPTPKLNIMAEELGAYRAGPRDIMKIYLDASGVLINNDVTDEKKHNINKEAKILMIELMGILLSFYRAGYF